MTGMACLLKKEFKEQIRTYRFLIVGGIFLFFGITTPLTLKYLPQIIQLAGEQIPIEIPPPTAVQSLAEYAGTIGQLGVLMTVLIGMGAVANELKSGTALLTLSKPVTRSAFITAKVFAMSTTFVISLALASLVCFAYTVWLIGGAEILPFVEMNLLMAVFLVFCLAITILYSALFKSSLAAGGLAIGTLIGQALLSSLPGVGNYIPGKLLGWGSGLLSGSTTTYWWSLGVTVVLIVGCLYLARSVLRRKEF